MPGDTFRPFSNTLASRGIVQSGMRENFTKANIAFGKVQTFVLLTCPSPMEHRSKIFTFSLTIPKIRI